MFPLPSRFSHLCLAVLIALGGLLGMAAGLSRATHAATLPPATFTVSTVNDSGAGSLRQAILDANAAAGANVIQIVATSTIALLSPLPVIGEAVTIQGPGVDQLALDGGNSWRVLDVATVPVTITNLTIQHGGPSAGDGGGLRSTGTLTLYNVNVLSNTAPTGGGGVHVNNTAHIEGGRFENNRSLGSMGGGLLATGQSLISGTAFISNTAAGQGGGAALTGGSHVRDGRFERNQSLNSNGGGLYAAGPVTLSDYTGCCFQRHAQCKW